MGIVKLKYTQPGSRWHVWTSVVPMLYTISTRLPSPILIVSWLVVFVVPQVVLAALNGRNGFYAALHFLSLFLTTNYVYENGYLENDLRTVKREEKPTIRLSPDVFQRMDEDYRLIQILRGIVLAFLFGAAVAFETELISMLGLGALAAVFKLYNRTRKRIGLLWLFIMTSLRFSVPVIGYLNLGEYLVWLLAYPVPKTIEFASRSRYELSLLRFVKMSFEWFRLVYYSIAFGLLFIAHIVYPLGRNRQTMLIILAYLAVLRFGFMTISNFTSMGDRAKSVSPIRREVAEEAQSSDQCGNEQSDGER